MSLESIQKKYMKSITQGKRNKEGAMKPHITKKSDGIITVKNAPLFKHSSKTFKVGKMFGAVSGYAGGY